MHVDGSVVTPVFTLPQTLLLRDGRIRTGGKAEIYVVINGRLEPDFEVTKDNTLSIVERSFTTASRARSRATLTATYALARSNGIGFNLTYIDENGPKASAAKGFDTAYMRPSTRRVSRRAGPAPSGSTPFPAAPTLKETASAVAN